MGWWANLLRRARLRGLVDGQVQTVRAEALENDAKDQAERWQDYGFAANPVDGQGLVINVGGHTIVLRMDRIAERPRLQPFEVAVWHKEGHMVLLKAGKVVQVDCDELIVNAAVKATFNTHTFEVNASAGSGFNTPTLAASAAITAGTNVSAAGNIAAGGDVADQGGAKTMAGMRTAYDSHTHGENNTHGGSTNTPNTPM